ncbi:MAG: NAD(P)H-dependent oxidoreductase [Candidatus Omnitrophica bacterium]|nr:NAD(P)H-dependent oxidoreductase [Candidatus Omnitrophota bacterium]MDD5552457.1 NAD(P)H-dependent oxidoreductase [Candidatus Omnitrophota bacterium]
MKSVIIYYSYSGNTQKAAEALSVYLKSEGSQADLIELKCLDEEKSFLLQCRRAFQHKMGQLQPVNFDLSVFDLICLGTPVWAFGPAPALNTYLDKCSGVEGKEVVLFTTYGSGMGNERCLDYMQGILSTKGAKKFKRFSIQQFKINNQEFVLSKIKQSLK